MLTELAPVSPNLRAAMGEYKLIIKPDYVTDGRVHRGLFRIHLDAGYLGTEGCIGIMRDTERKPLMSVTLLSDMLRSEGEKEVMLSVRYEVWDAKDLSTTYYGEDYRPVRAAEGGGV